MNILTIFDKEGRQTEAWRVDVKNGLYITNWRGVVKYDDINMSLIEKISTNNNNLLNNWLLDNINYGFDDKVQLYKRDALIQKIDSLGNIISNWKLVGCFISSFQGELEEKRKVIIERNNPFIDGLEVSLCFDCVDYLV
jgi:hypothetical protein